MLSWLITRVRSYGAIILVALYALCVIMPPVASAFPSGSAPSHCPTDDHHGVLRDGIAILGDGAIDKHADNSKEGGDGKLKCHAGACCGLFCCAATARVLRESGATPTQMKVGIQLALGKTKPVIADELGIQLSSVADLTKRLYQTLDVHNSTELATKIWLDQRQVEARQNLRRAG